MWPVPRKIDEIGRENYISQHYSYDNSTFDYDMAVFRVNSLFNTAHIISLAKVRPETGTNVSVSGWGKTTVRPVIPAKHLRWTFITIVVQEQCIASYANEKPSGLITELMVCAGLPQGGKDSCGCDSGGPLVIGNTQVGIVSKGPSRCATPTPGVYADVAALYSWIAEKIGEV